MREGMEDDQFDTGNPPDGKQPWFGPRRLGVGYGPRTWQGWLVSAVLLVYVVTVASVTKGHMPGMLFAIVPAIAVPFIIMAVQRR
jgi:hypothetical protein